MKNTIKNKKQPVTEGPLEDEDAVRLPRILSLEPGKYLAVLYGLIILALLFFLFVFPGLRNPGSVLVVASEPWGAAVRVDDVYFDYAPSEIFIPKGRHIISAVLPGFEQFDVELDVQNRAFASLFFPKKIYLKAELKEKESLAALKAAAKDFAEWSFIGEPTENRQIPLSLSEGVYRSAPSAVERPQALDILKAASRFMTSRAALKDLSRAYFLTASGGKAASPISALSGARLILQALDKNHNFAVALGEVLPNDNAEKLFKSSFYPEVWTEGGEKNAAFSAPREGEPLNIAGIAFSARFLPNTYTAATDFQHEEAVGPFYIAINELSVEQWNSFIAENPEWAFEKREELIKKGLVNSDYLLPLASYPSPASFYEDLPEYPKGSMPGISYFAAEAFCRYLTKKLPAYLSDFEARLPSEAEWEYAAKFAESHYGEAGVPRRMTAYISGKSGEIIGEAGLWEWCLGEYVPLNYVAPPLGSYGLSPERPVRGGSWAAGAGQISAEMRASLPPDSCSAWTGFRVVLAPKKKGGAPEA